MALLSEQYFAGPKLPRVARISKITHDGKLKGETLATDGNRIYFTEAIDGKQTAVQVSVNGGETSAVAIDLPDLTVWDYSVVRSELLVTAGDGVDGSFWRVPLPSGAPARIGTITGVSGGFSPDGEQIGYVRADGSLHLAKVDGGDDRVLPLGKNQQAHLSSWIDNDNVVINRDDIETDEGGVWTIALKNGDSQTGFAGR